jgi:uncharacterized protein YcgI (DUF1989 family)
MTSWSRAGAAVLAASLALIQASSACPDLCDDPACEQQNRGARLEDRPEYPSCGHEQAGAREAEFEIDDRSKSSAKRAPLSGDDRGTEVG